MKYRILLMLVAMFLSRYSGAQDDQQQTPEPTPELDALAVDGEPDLAASEEAPPSNEAANQEEEEAPGRFIPSEQISQDLGVSFPIDI